MSHTLSGSAGDILFHLAQLLNAKSSYTVELNIQSDNQNNVELGTLDLSDLSENQQQDIVEARSIPLEKLYNV